MSKKWLRMVVAFLPLLVLVGCGENSGSGGDPVVIEGIAVPQSQWAGMAFTARNVDPSFPTSYLYYYDFTTGEVRRLLDSQSSDPACFWVDGKLLFINRGEQLRNYRRFDPRSEEPSLEPRSFRRAKGLMDAGDPWDVASRGDGTDWLANPLSGTLATLDRSSGRMSQAVSDPALRPVALRTDGSRLDALHMGIDPSGGGTGEPQTAKVQPFRTTDTSTLEAIDTDPATETVDGHELTATNPAGFFPRSGGDYLIPGLCPSDVGACQAGADVYDPAAEEVRSLSRFGSAFPYRLHHQMTPAASENLVYAHVEDQGDGASKVIRLDVRSGEGTTVHHHDGDKLYGLFFDRSSRTLFVGDEADVRGELVLYQDGERMGSFAVDGVPYTAALVPHR